MGIHSAAVQLGSTRRELTIAPGAPWYRRLWHGWQRIARWIGNLLSRIITSLAFIVVLPIFAVLARFSRDPLELKHGPVRWIPLTQEPASVDDARRGI